VKNINPLLIITAIALFIGVINLPIGYYTFLRIIVFAGSIFVVYIDFDRNSINYWVIIFGLIAIIFNPFMPIYLNNKDYWIPIDVISGVLFVIKAFVIKRKNSHLT